jgi:hypothetical protein
VFFINQWTKLLELRLYCSPFLVGKTFLNYYPCNTYNHSLLTQTFLCLSAWFRSILNSESMIFHEVFESYIIASFSTFTYVITLTLQKTFSLYDF